MDSESTENFTDKADSEESEDEEYSYIRTRRGVIQVNKFKQEKKPDRLNGEYSYQNTIKQRVIGQPCIDCKMECDLRIAERFRQDNYLNFWGKLKSWEDRRTHIRRLVQVLRVPHPKNKTRKKFLRKYYLEMEDGLTLVCKTMFFNTLAISAKFIETTLQKYPENVLDETKVRLVNNPTSIPKSLDPNKPPKTSVNTNKPRDCNKEDGDHFSLTNKEELPIEAQLLDIKNKEDIKPPCSCPEQCGAKIPQETRQKIYDHFWLKLKSWEERKLFIINTIEKDRYTSIRTFVLPMKDGGHITVCQEMYQNTLCLDEKSVDLLSPKSEPIRVQKRKSNTEFPAIEQNEFNVEQLNHVTTGQLNQVSTGQLNQVTTEQLNHITTAQLNHITILNSIKLQNPKDFTKDIQLLPLMKRAKLEFTPLKPPCSCELQCRLKLTEDIRQQIHREFWNLPAQVDKKHFILSTIQTQINRNKITKEKTHEIKYFMLPFHYDSIIVCKEMYLHTLTVSEDFISSTIKNVNHDGSIIEDEDLHNNSHPSTKETSQGSNDNMNRSFQRKSFNKPQVLLRPGPDGDFINCADLLESQIKEDVLHSAKAEVRRIKKSRTSKKMGPPCPPSCRHQCSIKFNEEERKDLHEKFWCTMNWQERKQFVMNTVKEFPIKNRSIPGRLTKRNFSRIYTLPKNENKVTVCQKMYFNTLSICSKFVSTVHIWASQVKW